MRDQDGYVLISSKGEFLVKHLVWVKHLRDATIYPIEELNQMVREAKEKNWAIKPVRFMLVRRIRDEVQCLTASLKLSKVTARREDSPAPSQKKVEKTMDEKLYEEYGKKLYEEYRKKLLGDTKFLEALVGIIVERLNAGKPRPEKIFRNFWGLSNRTSNCLDRSGLTPEQVLDMTKKQLIDQCRSLGPKLADEVIAKRKPLPY